MLWLAIDMQRSPALVFLLSIVTCGLYLIYWYVQVYKEMEQLTGKTPTGNGYFIDFLLTVVTCGVWGIIVDYKISIQLDELLVARGLPPQDSGMIVIVLDIASYFTAAITYMATSALQQDILNKVWETGAQAQPPARTY